MYYSIFHYLSFCCQVCCQRPTKSASSGSTGRLRRSKMPKGGLEPPRPCEHNALNVACLPISPLRLFIYFRVLIPLRPAILILPLPSHLDLDTHYNTVSLPTCQEFFSPLLLFHPHQNTYGTNGPPSLTVNPDTSTLVTGGSIETIASSHQKHEQLGSTTGRISLTLVGEDW